MIIFNPDVSDEDLEAKLERTFEVLRDKGAEVGNVDRWGRRKLAYELDHHHEGYYALVAFEAEPEAAAELDRHLMLTDEVLRHKVIRLPEGTSTRPGATSSAPEAFLAAPAPGLDGAEAEDD
jgi:small subunit ribosomal protein S6